MFNQQNSWNPKIWRKNHTKKQDLKKKKNEGKHICMYIRIYIWIFISIYILGKKKETLLGRPHISLARARKRPEHKENVRFIPHGAWARYARVPALRARCRRLHARPPHRTAGKRVAGTLLQPIVVRQQAETTIFPCVFVIFSDIPWFFITFLETSWLRNWNKFWGFY